MDRRISADDGNSHLKPGPNIPSCPLPPINDQNSWIPLVSLEEMASKEYDVIVVGTGAGGGPPSGGCASSGEIRENG